MTDHSFVHLHVHTEYSLLDGLSDIPKLVKRARALDMPALAITDHGTMFGVIDFYREANKQEIKPIIGLEGYVAPRRMTDRDSKLDRRPFHMLLLARNMAGYKNLLKIASAGQLEGFYNRPRVDREFLEQHAEGLIATSGCIAAMIPQMILEGRETEARDLLDWHLQVFGKDNFFIELQQHDIRELETINRWLIDIGRRDDIRYVATNDVHYVLKDDYDPHDTLLCIQSSALKTDTDRLRMSDNSYYLADVEEMWAAFGHVNDGEPLRNTLLIAEMCEPLNLEREKYHLPVFPVPDGFDTETFLRHLCDVGLRWRYGARAEEADLRARLDHELTTIHGMGFDTYFLIVWDLCEFARAADIWWNVRGSGAGSVAAYCLGITNIDPVQNNLLFERFLNPGRVSMPDIDLDYPDDRREDMIRYAAQKYGEDKVAAIITFGTLGAKAAVRDVGRALGVDLAKVNAAARLIPTEPKPKQIYQYIDDNPELRQMVDTDPQLQAVMKTAAALQGVSRHASTHAAGVIISDLPLVEYIPLHRQTKGGDDAGIAIKQVTQFPMETCEQLGLLKVDFLGLSTLTIMRRASDLIRKNHGIELTMDNIPYRPTGDPETDRKLKETFELISRGETIGVFQVESTGMQAMLRDMRPSKFEHIVAAVSLYRPGPMDYIPTFNRRMHGEEPVVYHHPRLEQILSETYGICVSGDTIVINAATGQRVRMDQMEEHQGDFYIQTLDEDWKTTTARVTHWFDNGEKAVHEVVLANGARIKATADHQFLTEQGWQRLADLTPGTFVATPPYLVEPHRPAPSSRERLRVLAYLIGDGSLASGASVDFTGKDPTLLAEYVRCLSAFPDVVPVFLEQIRGVTRIGIRHKDGKQATSLLGWMRELGFKTPPAIRYPGGLRSHEKHIPEYIFGLNSDDICFFLASLWDCDGYIGNRLSHYKTISRQLALDVQTLLLRLGISSIIHESHYVGSQRGERTAYQVTTYETKRLADLLQPNMVSDKRLIPCQRGTSTTVDRLEFIAELDSRITMSRRRLQQQYGIDRQTFVKKRLASPRVHSDVVRDLAAAIPLPLTQKRLNVNWNAIESIEAAGVERVYDLTVEDTHNYVANNIIVHNCVYQEQIMQIAGSMFGYSLGDADLMRRAVSKKKKEDLQKHREIFLTSGPELDPTVTPEIAGKIFDDIEFFANYGFNKSHAADYAVITVQSAYMKAHYTPEYMAALLSVYFDDKTKVTTLLGECKRLDIPILPPDINTSSLDFDIQRSEGRAAIRFGMAAIKNVGIGAIQHILDERAARGPFRDLDEVCTRVDLRTVGKRALECLIKVGAFDSLNAGSRPQLLAALDRIISHSTEQHKAREQGQMGLFGEVALNSDDLLRNLPQTDPVSARDILNWERELLGIFVSSHPIDPVMEALKNTNVRTSHALKDIEHHDLSGQDVRFVGMVAALRKMPTKSKDMMGIVTLEDRLGTIDAVLFPRRWKQFEELITDGAVIVVMGKLDTSRGDVQIIVEDVTTRIESLIMDAVPADDDPFGEPIWLTDAPDITDESGEAVPAVNGIGSGYNGYHNGNGSITTETAKVFAASTALPTETQPEVIDYGAVEPSAFDGSALTGDDGSDFVYQDDAVPTAAHQRVDIHLEWDGDEAKLERRMRRIDGILTYHAGQDSFQITLIWDEGTHVYSFPERTTHACDSLKAELERVAGVMAVHFDPV